MTSSASRVIARLLGTRWLMRAPIGLFRARLGWIFAGRLVLIEHLGRTSGARRFAVLECVGRPRPAVVLIASGFGRRAQWYRNLEANGQAFVSVGFRSRVPADVRLLDDTESAEVLAEYGTAHPAAWAKLRDGMAVVQGTEDPDIPIVELRLRR